MDKNLLKDIREFVENFALAEELRESSFLITGATGLIGSTLIHCLFALNQGVKIIAPVRDIEKARCKLGAYDHLQLIECDLEILDFEMIGSVDYIVHCAAPTSSRFFVDYPVETFHSIFNISDRILDYAKKSCIKSMVYLSSLEVYGQILDDSKPIVENLQGYLNPIEVRSSYPMAKRAVENLCSLYCHEFNVPVKIARLTQTTGAGLSNDDNRVIALFTRLAAHGKDIVLRTTGESARPYCYTTDAVSAILYILIKGEKGEVYNVANENTYISARDLAYYVQEHVNPNINVRFELNDDSGYAPVTKHKLCSKKIKQLGWSPLIDLEAMINRLVLSLKNY